MRIRRTQPPVGYRVSLGTLMSAATRASFKRGYREHVFEREVAEHFGSRYASAVSSGKAALTMILLALHKLSGRRKVIIPAYTCYSLPSAIVKAGMEVVPCDIARGSFDYDFDRLIPLLQPDVLCVLSVHLFGISSDTARLKSLVRDSGIFVVEDAAQALNGTRNGRRLGTEGDAGFFSLGRGKNITCGSGGIVVTDSEPIIGALMAVSTGLSRTTPARDVSTFVTLMLLRWFISPSLYWFPAGLPFLRLGETIFHEDFPVSWLSDFQALLLRGWTGQLAELDATRKLNAGYYLTHIAGAQRHSKEIGEEIPYLRFPVVLPGSAEKHRILVERDGAALGMSGMYPASVASIPQLQNQLAGLRFPEAERVAASLITLPTQAFVTDDDRSQIAVLVNDVLAHRARPRAIRVEEAGVTAHS